MRFLTWFKLFRWLGPWTSITRMPQADREVLPVSAPSGRKTELVVWTPVRGEPNGALFLIPGLHFEGPAHPRLERLARIGAAAGLLVGSPALPDFLDMRVRPGTGADALAAFDAFLAHPRMPSVRPGLMSISFGAHPAMVIATSERFRDRVGGLLCYGGYLNWKVPIRYSWENGPGVPFDARNNPVAYTFLLDALPPASDRAAVLAAWDAYIRGTWGDETMVDEEPRRALAMSLAEGLDASDRCLFLRGCRMEEGAFRLLDEALERIDGMDWLEIGPMLPRLRAPLFAVHGLDDEISPPEQSRRLVEACPDHVDARSYLTGLYGHSGQHSGAGTGLGALLRELRVFARLVSAIVKISRTGV